MSGAENSTRDKSAWHDLVWWQLLLPPGWTVHGWTGRTSASAYSPNGSRIVQLDAELLVDLREKAAAEVST